MNDLTDTAKERLKKSRDHTHEWRKEAVDCFNFRAGDQWSPEDRATMEEELRPPITFNRIGPVIDVVSGHEVANRNEIRFFPRTMEDVQVNEMLTAAMKWADDECEAEDEISDAFSDMLTCGMGWTETRMSYDEDVDGKIHTAERVPPLEMYWDYAAKKRNLSDARYIMRMKWIPREEVEQRWPKAKKIDPEEGIVNENEDDPAMEAHEAYPPFYEDASVSEWWKPHEGMYRVMQYQYWERETIYRIGDPQSGKLIELSENKYNRIKDRIPDLRVIRQMKKVYYQSFILGSTELETNKLSCQNFTLRAMCGKRDTIKNVWYGIVRGMLDPQRWSNKFMSNIQDIVSSNRQGGAFVEESALVDPRRAEEDWNRADALIQVRDGALGQNKIKEREPAQYPSGLDRLLQFSITSIPDVTGVNLELMGLADRTQANVLEMTRKRAGMTILSNLFDALRRYNKERGKVVLHYIQNYISDGRLIRIIGKDGNPKFIPLMKQPDVAKYDVIVDEAPNSVNKKDETFAMLMQIAPFMIKAGIQVPPEILDYVPLPTSLTEKWKQVLQPTPEQQQQKQTMQRQELAKAAKDESVAMLNKVKAQKEMQSNDHSEVTKLLLEAKRLELDAVRMMMDGAEKDLLAQLKREELQLKAQEVQLKQQLQNKKVAANGT